MNDLAKDRDRDADEAVVHLASRKAAVRNATCLLDSTDVLISLHADLHGKR